MHLPRIRQLLYNRFGFKAEGFIVGFYEDYLHSVACFDERVSAAPPTMNTHFSACGHEWIPADVGGSLLVYSGEAGDGRIEMPAPGGAYVSLPVIIPSSGTQHNSLHPIFQLITPG